MNSTKFIICNPIVSTNQHLVTEFNGYFIIFKLGHTQSPIKRKQYHRPHILHIDLTFHFMPNPTTQSQNTSMRRNGCDDTNLSISMNLQGPQPLMMIVGLSNLGWQYTVLYDSCGNVVVYSAWQLLIVWYRFGVRAFAVLSLEILVASDFDKVAGTAIYYLQYYDM